MKRENENAALGAENTENGEANESTPSLSKSGWKVKSTPQLDLRTEIFVLDVLAQTLNRLYVDKDKRYDILSYVLSKCEEANEA